MGVQAKGRSPDTMTTDMDDSRTMDLLKLQAGDLPERTSFCPEDHEIAEYFDGAMTPRVRSSLERHLSTCRFCQARIGILHRTESDTVARRVSESQLAAAKQLARQASPGVLAGWRMLATAAVLVLALYVVIDKDRSPAERTSRSPESGTTTDAGQRSVRTAGRIHTAVEILQPAKGSRIGPGTRVQWEPIAGSLHYDLFLISSTGDVLWAERLQETEWTVVNQIAQEGTGPIYLRIDASLEDGRTLTSGHLALEAEGGG